MTILWTAALVLGILVGVIVVLTWVYPWLDHWLSHLDKIGNVPVFYEDDEDEDSP